MGDHAKFSPSSAKQWIACPASWKHNVAVEGEPQESSGAAREGTIAHAVAEFALGSNVDPRSLIGKTLQVEVDGVTESIVVEKEMADNLHAYTSHCDMLAMLADRRMVEERVFVDLEIHNGERTNELLWGTADFIAITESERIDVVDLKYGGMAVDPVENPQGIAYLLGALALTEHKPVKSAAIHIVQPRLSKEPKIWEIEDVEELRAKWVPIFEQAIMRAKECAAITRKLEQHYNAGDHCRFCAAIVDCEAFAKHMIDITAEELEAIEDDPAALPDTSFEKLVERFAAKGIVTHYYDKLEDYLKRAARKGREVPGFKIVRALGNRRWTLDDKEMMVKLRNQGLKKKDFVVEKVASPAKVEKLIDNEKFLERWVTRNDNGEKLVPLTDRRPSVDVRAEIEVIPTEEPQAAETLPEADSAPSNESLLMGLIELGESDEQNETEEDELIL